jgi:hypothetical protein
MLIYTETPSPRTDYIVNHIFKNMLCCKYRITYNNDEYLSSTEPKIAYSKKHLVTGLCIIETGFLSENKISPIQINTTETELWQKIFFFTPENKIIPFDIFSAVFYLISRYEEYLPFSPDSFNRFPYTSSLLYKEKIIDKPVVDHWIFRLKELLLSVYPELIFNHKKYQFISTIDIDNAFAYKEKNIITTSGSFIKSILKGKPQLLRERILVLKGKQPDPYDSYFFIKNIHSTFNLRAKIFILSGGNSRLDRNISIQNPEFKSKLLLMSEICDWGIHPSFSSNKKHTAGREKLLLEKVVQKEITISRQHFLVLHFPYTYQQLIKIGIKADYSMGYSNIAGYRAGTCTPFCFFDLSTNKATALEILPFVWMDQTLKQHLKLTPDEAKKFITNNINEIKYYNGTFVSLWHNESLNDSGNWQGWREVFEFMLKNANL